MQPTKQLPDYRASPNFFVGPIGLFEIWRLAIIITSLVISVGKLSTHIFAFCLLLLGSHRTVALYPTQFSSAVGDIVKDAASLRDQLPLATVAGRQDVHWSGECEKLPPTKGDPHLSPSSYHPSPGVYLALRAALPC